MGTTLSGSKTEQYQTRNENGKPIFVVHPNWLIESCEQGKLLSEFDYQITQRKNDISQYLIRPNPKPGENPPGDLAAFKTQPKLPPTGSRPLAGISSLLGPSPKKVDPPKLDTNDKKRARPLSLEPEQPKKKPRIDEPTNNPIPPRQTTNVKPKLKLPDQLQPAFQPEDFPKAQRKNIKAKK